MKPVFRSLALAFTCTQILLVVCSVGGLAVNAVSTGLCALKLVGLVKNLTPGNPRQYVITQLLNLSLP